MTGRQILYFHWSCVISSHSGLGHVSLHLGVFSARRCYFMRNETNESDAMSSVASLGCWIVYVYIQPSNLKVKLISLVLISQFRGIRQRDVTSIIDNSTVAIDVCQFLCNSAPSTDCTDAVLQCQQRDLGSELSLFWKGARTKLSKVFR